MKTIVNEKIRMAKNPLLVVRAFLLSLFLFGLVRLGSEGFPKSILPLSMMMAVTGVYLMSWIFLLSLVAQARLLWANNSFAFFWGQVHFWICLFAIGDLASSQMNFRKTSLPLQYSIAFNPDLYAIVMLVSAALSCIQLLRSGKGLLHNYAIYILSTLSGYLFLWAGRLDW